MIENFEQFEIEVSKLSTKDDYKKYKSKLRRVRAYSYNSFSCLLRMGYGIFESIRMVEEIFRISTETMFTEEDIIYMFIRLQRWNGFKR